MTIEASVHVLPQTNRLRALHTIIRDKDVSREDFVFYSDQVIRMLLDAGLDRLPYEPKVVTTPVGAYYEGARLTSKICPVSIIRAGESMEPEFRSMYPEAPVGKILIQRNKQTKLPKLYYSHLPEDIATRHVLVFEPMLATGGSAETAIQVLLDKGVKEKNIIFINFLAAPEGIERVLNKFPGVQIVTSSVEKKLNEHAFMIPGIGDFGDRYFGTADAGANND